MKILMVGLGSIGQRHLRNIKRLYGDDIKISAYRVRGLRQTFSDDMQIREGIDLETEYKMNVFYDIEAAFQDKPDIVFVTNITAKHMEIALKAAEAGCDIFLEKPISDSMEGVSKLREILSANGNILYVGYQNRFHPCIQKIKELLNDKKIGSLISVDNEYGERLTSMHMYEDYSKTYMALRSMGGGPVLNLQIHCLDYLQWLFGTPETVYCVSGTNSEMNVDVEDYASSLYCFRQKNGVKLPVYSHTDFLQFPPQHRLKIVGTAGRIEADFNVPSVAVYENGTLVENIRYPDFVRNDMFLAELKEFMDCIKTRKQPGSNLDQGIIGLRMALAAKESSRQNRQIMMERM